MATYYVRSSGGSDANDGLSFANAFATIAHAVYANGVGNAALAAGDTVRICADAEHIVTAEIMLNTRSGSPALPITITGADATGTVDGTEAVIRPTTSVIANLFSNGTTGTVTDITFRYLDVRGDDVGAVTRVTILFNLATTNTSKRWRWQDCKFVGASSDNVITRGTGFEFDSCDSSEAGRDGFGQNGTSDSANYVGCRAFDNTGSGYDMGTVSGNYAFCKAYRNGAHGFHAASGTNSFTSVLINNTAYDNTGSGVRINSADSSTTSTLFANNSFVNNGAYGVDWSSLTTFEELRILTMTSRSNHSHGNTSGNSSLDGSVAWADLALGNITGDPLFTAPASADFTPATGSPLIGAGLAGGDIGAVKSQPASGGGSTGRQGLHAIESGAV